MLMYAIDNNPGREEVNLISSSKNVRQLTGPL